MNILVISVIAIILIINIAMISRYIFKEVNKSKNNKFDMLNKKKKTKKEKELIEKVTQDLADRLDKLERVMKYKSASLILNEPVVEQPLMLCSDEKFENHTLNFCNGALLGFPTKALPYLINALQELYNKNGLEHFGGDQKKFDDYTADITKDLVIDVIDLNSVTPAPQSTSKKVVEKLMKVYMENIDKIKDMSEEEIAELADKVGEMQQDVEESIAKEQSGNLSPAQQKELHEETAKKMMENIKEIEFKLTGKIDCSDEDIDFAKIKSVYEKYGDKAALEELMRLPEEKRDEILAKGLNIFKK